VAAPGHGTWRPGRGARSVIFPRHTLPLVPPHHCVDCVCVCAQINTAPGPSSRLTTSCSSRCSLSTRTAGRTPPPPPPPPALLSPPPSFLPQPGSARPSAPSSARPPPPPSPPSSPTTRGRPRPARRARPPRAPAPAPAPSTPPTEPSSCRARGAPRPARSQGPTARATRGSRAPARTSRRESVPPRARRRPLRVGSRPPRGRPGTRAPPPSPAPDRRPARRRRRRRRCRWRAWRRRAWPRAPRRRTGTTRGPRRRTEGERGKGRGGNETAVWDDGTRVADVKRAQWPSSTHRNRLRGRCSLLSEQLVGHGLEHGGVDERRHVDLGCENGCRDLPTKHGSKNGYEAPRGQGSMATMSMETESDRGAGGVGGARARDDSRRLARSKKKYGGLHLPPNLSLSLREHARPAPALSWNRGAHSPRYSAPRERSVARLHCEAARGSRLRTNARSEGNRSSPPRDVRARAQSGRSGPHAPFRGCRPLLNVQAPRGTASALFPRRSV
jgi:hypothetical protein